MGASFNPFEDRLSRDIRNELSETIGDVLATGSLQAAERAAQQFLKQGLAPVYSDYIEDRLNRYRAALTQLAHQQAPDLLAQAAALWDAGLYFEVHEILEPAWMSASGDRRQILQALIRAAGTYINLELGYLERARKISTKALPILERFEQQLEPAIRAGALIAALHNLATVAPQLSHERSD